MTIRFTKKYGNRTLRRDTSNVFQLSQLPDGANVGCGELCVSPHLPYIISSCGIACTFWAETGYPNVWRMVLSNPVVDSGTTFVETVNDTVQQNRFSGGTSPVNATSDVESTNTAAWHDWTGTQSINLVNNTQGLCRWVAGSVSYVERGLYITVDLPNAGTAVTDTRTRYSEIYEVSRRLDLGDQNHPLASLDNVSNPTEEGRPADWQSPPANPFDPPTFDPVRNRNVEQLTITADYEGWYAIFDIGTLPTVQFFRTLSRRGRLNNSTGPGWIPPIMEYVVGNHTTVGSQPTLADFANDYAMSYRVPSNILCAGGGPYPMTGAATQVNPNPDFPTGVNAATLYAIPQ